MTRRNKALLSVILCGLGLTPFVMPKILRALPHPEKAATATRPPASPKALKVSAFVLRPTVLVETLTATGTLRADESVDLQAEIAGKIVAINFQEGARVRQGELLLKINDAELAAALQRAVARRDLARGREQRLRQLLRNGGVNQQEYDTVLGELNVQEAEVRLIEAQLAKTEIRAPFDGIVGLRFVSEGSYVSPATRIATLQNLAHMKLDFSLPEKHLARIGLGLSVLFKVAGCEQPFTGEVYAIEPRVDVATRTALLRAVCRNPDARLLPGAFASVEFALAEVPDALLVPPVAVVPGLTEKNVFVARDGHAVRRAVEIGARTATNVHILAGLQPDDVVITSGIQSLRPGLAVEVMP